MCDKSTWDALVFICDRFLGLRTWSIRIMHLEIVRKSALMEGTTNYTIVSRDRRQQYSQCMASSSYTVLLKRTKSQLPWRLRKTISSVESHSRVENNEAIIKQIPFDHRRFETKHALHRGNKTKKKQPERGSSSRVCINIFSYQVSQVSHDRM
jgi:hypothetical protein